MPYVRTAGPPPVCGDGPAGPDWAGRPARLTVLTRVAGLLEHAAHARGELRALERRRETGILQRPHHVAALHGQEERRLVQHPPQLVAREHQPHPARADGRAEIRRGERLADGGIRQGAAQVAPQQQLPHLRLRQRRGQLRRLQGGAQLLRREHLQRRRLRQRLPELGVLELPAQPRVGDRLPELRIGERQHDPRVPQEEHEVLVRQGQPQIPAAERQGEVRVRQRRRELRVREHEPQPRIGQRLRHRRIGERQTQLGIRQLRAELGIREQLPRVLVADDGVEHLALQELLRRGLVAELDVLGADLLGLVALGSADRALGPAQGRWPAGVRQHREPEHGRSREPPHHLPRHSMLSRIQL